MRRPTTKGVIVIGMIDLSVLQKAPKIIDFSAICKLKEEQVPPAKTKDRKVEKVSDVDLAWEIYREDSYNL